MGTGQGAEGLLDEALDDGADDVDVVELVGADVSLGFSCTRVEKHAHMRIYI